ncbi:MAG: sensor hybrid histidine kinase, partial [Labilithrix sp.]|nr:sensor hybrid histidine kinase [Labilithrix sp.]
MEILLSAKVEGLRARLERDGHHVVDFEPGSVPPADTARVAVIEGLDAVARATDLACHILALVTPAELRQIQACPRAVSDFALLPVADGELTARIARLATIPSWREQELHRLLALAVERTSDIVEVAAPSAHLQYVNPSYERSLGVSREEAIGKTPAQLVRSDYHTREFFQQLDTTLRRGETWAGTLVSRARDG